MTETPEAVGPDMDAEGWDDAADGASYPEYPANPHNHKFTISMNGQGPMLVVRGNTVEEVKEAFEELEDAAVGAALGRGWAAVRAGAALGNGLGATPAPPAPAGPQAPPAPAYGAPAPPPPPPAPQGYGGQQGSGRAEPKPRPPWPQVYKISIARGDQSFKQYREANQGYFKGKVQWAGGGDYWIHGDVVQSVAQWHPVPA